MKPVTLLTSARADVRSEKNYYKKIDPKLARRFQAAVEKAVQGISRQPLLMEAKEYDTRRWPVGDGFPHGVLYRNGSEEVLVLAVFHPRCIKHGVTLATRNVRDFEGVDVDKVNPWVDPP